LEVHPQLSNNGYPVDGALVGTGSVRASTPTSVEAPYAYLMLSSVKAPYTLFMPPSVWEYLICLLLYAKGFVQQS
jgi:hypothetical protein